MKIYNPFSNEITAIDGLRDFWQYLIAPIGVLALSSHIGGITLLFGTGFFAANRVNVGKFLVIVGTGQGLFTIGIQYSGIDTEALLMPPSSTLVPVTRRWPNPTGSTYRTIVSPGLNRFAGRCSLYTP
jgi:hypothetical protein